MKKQIIGVTTALLTAAIFTVSASAEYYINTKQDGNTVKAEVVADGANLSAMEFTVKLPDNIDTDDFYTIDGSFFNEENGYFAWAGIYAPEDGTVMYSVTFTVEDGYKGKLTINPVEGYEDDMPVTLTADIIGKDAESDEKDGTEDKDTSDDDTETSDSEATSDIEGETSDIEGETSDIEGETSDNTNANKPDYNPNTGIAIDCTAAVIAGAAVLATVKRRK